MASALTLQSSRRLFSGNTIPLLGFGVAYGFGKEEEFAVLTKPSLADALNVGYRHVDTAQMYKNEKHVGEGIRESSIPRSGIFVTSKLADHSADYDATLKAVDDSLTALGFDYIDLYLLHRAADNRKLRLEQWRALVDSKGQERDFTIPSNARNIQEIKDVGLELPAVNQVELHPFCQQKPIAKCCQENGKVVEAYCAVVRGAMDHPVIADIAKKHNKDNAQVLLRWSLQTGHIPLVRSSNSGRIRSNADLYNFELDADDMQQLETLDKGAEGACSWNPVNID